MSRSEYKNHTEAFFKGKHAVMKQDVINYGGGRIAKGSIVTIVGKWNGFQIKFDDVYITRVNPEKIEFDFEKYKNLAPC